MTLQYKKQQAMLKLKQSEAEAKRSNKENIQSNACAIKFREGKASL